MSRVRVALAATIAVVAGCSVLGDRPDAPPPAASPLSVGPRPSIGAGQVHATDWPTYHRDARRSGVSPTTPPVRRLEAAWRVRLDQAVYAQPLVVGRVVIAATENNSVYALDAATGRQVWRAWLGNPVPKSALPCGNIDPLGITGTPVYDPVTRRVFAVTETSGGTHTLVGLDVRTGRVTVRVPVEPPRGEPIAHQQRAALALYRGRVYVAYGGLYGDCGNYVGAVVSVTTAGTQPASWAVPTTREGGIWAPGGPLIAPDGSLYVSVGNGEQRSAYDGSDSVTRLSPQLTRLGFFAPNQWSEDNAADLDLGSMSPALVGNRLVISGKRGTAYLLDPAALGGIGGELAALRSCAGYGAAAVSGTSVFIPCLDGVRQLVAGPTTLRAGWAGPSAANGPPVIGGGAVWSVGRDEGVLYVLDERTGAVRTTYGVGPVANFASPTLSGPRVFVPTRTGIVALTVR